MSIGNPIGFISGTRCQTDRVSIGSGIGFASPVPVPDPVPTSTPIPNRYLGDAQPASRLDLEVGKC